MSRVEKTRALLLRRHDFSETSFVVGMFTEDFGKIRAIAKGAKREKSPLHGALEPLTLCEVVIYLKRPPRLHILSQAKTIEYWRGIRSDLSSFYTAHHFAELLLSAMPDEDPQPETFERALTAFRQTSTGGKVDVVALAFEASLLRLIGSFPRLDVCIGCEKSWKKREATIFHPLSGGAYHLRCAREKGIPGIRVKPGALQVLRQFSKDRVPRPDRVTLAPAVAKDMRAVLDVYYRFLLERDLRSRRFL